METGPKRLELFAELLGSRRTIGILLNSRRSISQAELGDLVKAASALGLQPQVLYAQTENELEMVFATLSKSATAGLTISGDPFFNSRAEYLGELSLKYMLPTMFQAREFAVAGGLISYGSNVAEFERLLGVYIGRILTGEKPSDLPVQQPTKLELVINLKTAKVLGVAVPNTLLVRADEVIE